MQAMQVVYICIWKDKSLNTNTELLWYPYHDCECPAPRIRVSCGGKAVLKGYLKGGLRRVPY